MRRNVHRRDFTLDRKKGAQKPFRSGFDAKVNMYCTISLYIDI